MGVNKIFLTLTLVISVVACTKKEPEQNCEYKCVDEQEREVQVCHGSGGGGRSLLGAAVGGTLFGKTGAVVGSIAGSSSGSTRCYTEKEKFCAHHATVCLPNPKYRKDK